MNLVHTCPDIPDNWRGGITAASKVLGIDPKTLRSRTKLSKYAGGIGWTPKPGGKRGMVFTGREIKRFWLSYA